MVNFNHNFSLLNSPYQFDHALVGQYSKNYAPSPEWISLTERNAIRGFSRSSQSADHGWYMKNTLSKHFFMGNILFTPRMAITKHYLMWKPAVVGGFPIVINRTNLYRYWAV